MLAILVREADRAWESENSDPIADSRFARLAFGAQLARTDGVSRVFDGCALTGRGVQAALYSHDAMRLGYLRRNLMIDGLGRPQVAGTRSETR